MVWYAGSEPEREKATQAVPDDNWPLDFLILNVRGQTLTNAFQKRVSYRGLPCKPSQGYYMALIGIFEMRHRAVPDVATATQAGNQYHRASTSMDLHGKCRRLLR